MGTEELKSRQIEQIRHFHFPHGKEKIPHENWDENPYKGRFVQPAELFMDICNGREGLRGD